MKKIIGVLMALILTFVAAASAMAATKATKGNNYTIPKEGTVLQNEEDRKIETKTPAARNPIIPGESPTTGLQWSGTYLPMLVQISNPQGTVKYNGATVKSAGVGNRAPWGGQYADIVYEGILYRTGETRISFLFSDRLDEGVPTSVGPVRSARIGHVLLREEWQSGFIYAGGPRREENNIAEMFNELGASDKGVLFDLLTNKWDNYRQRVKGLKNPDNLDVNVVGLRGTIPSTYTASAHAFLFSDSNPYTDGYDMAYNINLDWGHKNWLSHFTYDENENLYYRYSGDAPYMTYPSATEAGNVDDTNSVWMSFSNVIIQRVPYEYTNNSKIMPVMQSVGKGNADIFIGGRYIAGYWVREDNESPTVFYDDKGNELQFTRGKTYIANFPPEALLTFTGVE
ncbi:MAG TPA: DUF3048 C-terminal domain-containing protein [Candidatus Limiplasma sp.]|nr:DUF3048 C-terminal domain-containing protein [Candidatus Limiplasma sp.]HPR78280.1 DUF3048 C-terminal domain-containing protein [Candidatus Limiplasma sp.]